MAGTRSSHGAPLTLAEDASIAPAPGVIFISRARQDQERGEALATAPCIVVAFSRGLAGQRPVAPVAERCGRSGLRHPAL
jgi:hypothetical protein